MKYKTNYSKIIQITFVESCKSSNLKIAWEEKIHGRKFRKFKSTTKKI